jgi:hypothetical protein
MPTKHTVTDSRGQVHKRTSANHVYSHAIVAHFPAVPADKYGRAWPARTRCEWAGSAQLAAKAARRFNADSVEIIPATIVAPRDRRVVVNPDCIGDGPVADMLRDSLKRGAVRS